LIEKVKAKDFNGVFSFYEKQKREGIAIRSEFYNTMLAVCDKAEHLNFVYSIINEMMYTGANISEQTYVALIRCLSDADRIEEAIDHLNRIDESNLRVRTFQPIFEALCLKRRDIKNAISLLNRMLNIQVNPKSQQLYMLFKLYGNERVTKTRKIQEDMNSVVRRISHSVLGLYHAQIVDLAKHYGTSEVSPDQDDYESILIDSFDQLEGSVILDNRTKDYSATAFNSSITSNRDLDDFGDFDIDGVLDIPNDNYAKLGIPSKFQYNNNHERIIDHCFLTEDLDVESIPEKFIIKEALPDHMKKTRKARVVGILNSSNSSITSITDDSIAISCRCPNCGYTLKRLALNQTERDIMKNSLLHFADNEKARRGHSKSSFLLVIF
jgi:hypothetical protein